MGKLNFLVVFATLGLGTAHQKYVPMVPNGSKINATAAIGHNDPAGGGSRNAFGTAFGNDQHVWNAQLCCEDSDKDGFTNGMELGDPCCVWKEGQTPAYTTDLSNPGNAVSKPWERKPPTCPGNPCGAALRG